MLYKDCTRCQNVVPVYYGIRCPVSMFTVAHTMMRGQQGNGAGTRHLFVWPLRCSCLVWRRTGHVSGSRSAWRSSQNPKTPDTACRLIPCSFCWGTLFLGFGIYKHPVGYFEKGYGMSLQVRSRLGQGPSNKAEGMLTRLRRKPPCKSGLF